MTDIYLGDEIPCYMEGVHEQSDCLISTYER